MEIGYRYAPLPIYHMLQPYPHTAFSVSFRKALWPAAPGLSVPFWNCTMERLRVSVGLRGTVEYIELVFHANVLTFLHSKRARSIL
jgi:hypothetical protein